MQLTFEIKSTAHALLAAEFMAKFFKLDNEEAVFHYTAAKEIVKEAPVTDAEVKAAVQEAEAQVTAEEVIEKAATKPAKPSKPVAPAELQRIAQAKARSAGAEAVKNAIAKYGGSNINTTPAEKLLELKEALEALE